MRRVARLAVAAALAGAGMATAMPGPAAAQPAAATPTTEYVIKPGDICLGIAIRVLDDRNAVDAIHRANPGLGPLPHVLVPGRVMKLPRKKAAGDATLAGFTGAVRTLTGTTGTWDPAHRGAALQKTSLVSTSDGATAAVAFSDTKQLLLREKTVVEIEATTVRAPRVTVGKASIQRGTVRAHVLGAAGAGALDLTTPVGLVSMTSGGDALISITDAHVLIANVRGKPLALRGATFRIALPAGKAIRVPRGARPDKPRALLAAPTWATDATATAVPAVGTTGAALTAAWSPVVGATAYRFEVDAPSGVAVLSTELPASTTRVELRGVPAGQYRARVAAIDADRFEGSLAADLELTVVAIAVAAPGSAAPSPSTTTSTTAPASTGAELPLTPSTATTPPPTPTVAQGTALGGAHLTCATAATSGAPLVLTTPGPTTVSCTTTDGQAVAPFAVTVAPVTATTADGATSVTVTRGDHQQIAITLASDAALGNQWRVDPGPGLTCDDFTPHERGISIRVGIDGDAPATSALDVVDDRTGSRVATLPVVITDTPPPRDDIVQPTDTRPNFPPPRIVAAGRARITAGAFAGYTAFPSGMREGLELGDAPVTAYQVDSGAGVGMRASLWLHREIFVELEAGLWPTGFVAADEPAWITSGHALVGYQLVDGTRLGARAAAGAGAYALLGDATYARSDVDPDLTWGLTGTLRMGGDLSLRLDGRHRIAPDRAEAGVTHVFEATIGIEAVVTRIPAVR